MKCNVYKLAALVAMAASCGLVSCGQSPNRAVSASDSAPPAVEVIAVKSQKLSTTEELPAELAPYESVDLYAKETGFVKSIRVDRGSYAKQGEILAVLEAPELVAHRAQANAAYQSAESQLAGAEAKLAADQTTYQHMKDASKTPGVVAANDLNIAQKATQADEANAEALRKNADAAQEGLRAVTQLESYLNITAPFDGQVTTRYVHPGALVGPAGGAGTTTPIVRIETTTRHRLVVPVPESDIANVPEGTMVEFTVPSNPGKMYHGPIARISHGVDVKTRTMPVELDIHDPHGELVPGTYCQVEWPVRRSYVTLFVPITAVASDLQRNFAIRVVQNRTEWVDVKTGSSVAGWTEVFGNLHEGDDVVIRASDQIREGTEVSARRAESK